MTDRVHPGDSPNQVPTKPAQPLPEKPVPPPGTYVVQIPKDQIYRVPPSENGHRYQKYGHYRSRRNPCCCCLCWILSLIILLIILAVIAAGVFYVIVRPKAPTYSVENLSIKGINLTLSDLTVSPQFDVTVKARNPNKKIGIHYEKKSSVSISHSDTELCTGVLPAFYQPTNNVTSFQTALTGSGIRLTTEAHNALMDEQKSGNIPLVLKLRVPARIEVGSIKTWTFTVKVHCDIRVDKLTVNSKIVSKTCDVNVKLW